LKERRRITLKMINMGAASRQLHHQNQHQTTYAKDLPGFLQEDSVTTCRKSSSSQAAR